MTAADVNSFLNAELGAVMRYRRDLHRIPETANTERETQRYIFGALQALQPDLLAPIADTGVKCVFKSAAAGEKRPAIAFRADMDALNVTEPAGCAFRSQHEGRMHACGHDGHMATLLGLADFCAANRTRLARDVVLLFQPSEEASGGATRVIEAGGLSDPAASEIYGMHLMPMLMDGEIACPDGPLMASVYDFDVEISGSSAHGAMPQLGCDALAAAVALYNLLQTVITRQTDAFNTKVLTVGRMYAGTARNIVPGKATLECTLRNFSDESEAQCLELIRRHVRAVEVAYGVSCVITPRCHYLPVVNDAAAAARVRAAAGDMAVSCAPLTISEDFSFYQRAVPGAFFFCGIAREGMYNAPLHSPEFAFDEKSLLNGLRVFVNLVELV